MDLVIAYDCYRYNEEWYLIEMLLDVRAEDIALNEVVVPQKGIPASDWQTAYLEQYLNAEGTERLCELYAVPQEGAAPSRIVFFIYKTEAAVLQTPYGNFLLDGEHDVPERLRSIIEFEGD